MFSPLLGLRGSPNCLSISTVPKSHTRRGAVRSLRRMFQQYLRGSSSSPFFLTVFQISKRQPSHRNPCLESPLQNPNLFKRPCTDSPSGSQTSGSCTLRALPGSRFSRSTIGCTTRLWKGWRVRISSCAKRLRGQAIGTRLPLLCLGARDRLGRLGCCGRFLDYRIRKGCEKDSSFAHENRQCKGTKESRCLATENGDDDKTVRYNVNIGMIHVCTPSSRNYDQRETPTPPPRRPRPPPPRRPYPPT